MITLYIIRGYVCLVDCLCCTVCAGWIQFGGYSTNALAGRLLDCEASMLVVGGRCVATG